jgi:poly-gamma-glutamate synthesis protein (capsule biosynthesis protein)
MKVALLGDMAFYGKYSVDAGPGVFRYFDEVREYLAGFDHVVGNLETPFCVGLKPKGQKSAYISSSPKNVELMKYLNISAVNLANNHIFDYGKLGYLQTIATLNEAEVDYFGVDGRAIELESDSAKVALHGYCSFNTNPLGVSRVPDSGLNILDVETVIGEIERHDRHGCLNVVSIHSGQEHVNYPSLEDIAMARRFSESGPLVYYGHHPHVMQGYEFIRESLIAYSLGNFCFDDVYTDKSSEPLIKQSDNNKTGMIVELEVHGNRLTNWRIRTIYAGSKSLILDPEGASNLLAHYCDGFGDEAELYSIRRDALIARYIGNRKKMRDWAWYAKRLNLNSVGIILRSKWNQYLHRKHVSRYLARGRIR